MKYYIDITLLPDAEANLGFLWEKVYQQVHLALVENKTSANNSEIGLSIPDYSDNSFPLGSKLRLLASSEKLLQQLDIGKWLNRLTDYAHFTSIRAVPDNVKSFAKFKRIRSEKIMVDGKEKMKKLDTNIERLARRRVKRKGETFEQALKYFNGFQQRETNLPFINIKSLSENKQFKLFIEREFVDNPETGVFSCYGLSKETTVPWF